MAYTGKKPIDHTDVTQSQSMTVTDDLTVDSTTLHVDSTNNRVGVGTASPAFALDVQSTSDPAQIRLKEDGNTNGLRIVNFDGDEAQINNVDNGPLVIKTNNTERMRILSGGGLTFNGDTAATNALDDYEEGDWTPTYIGASSNPTVTYDIQVGKYVKVGGLVHAAFVLRSDAASGGSGSLFVSGLPFAGAVTTNAFYSGSVGYSAFFTTRNPQALHIGSNGTTIVLICRSDSTDANSSLRLAVQTSNLTNAANSNFLVAQMTYPTDA